MPENPDGAGSVREEAERLVAAALAAAQVAVRTATSDAARGAVREAVRTATSDAARGVVREAVRDAVRGAGRDDSPVSDTLRAAGRLLAGGAGGAGERLFAGGHVATGSAECCVCPVCRAIAAIRDPSPQLALKLAVGAGDLASGLTDVLRSLGDLMGSAPTRPRGARRPRTGPDPDSVWHTATAAQTWTEPAGPAGTGAAGPARPAGSGGGDGRPGEPDDPWHAATTDQA